MSRQSEIAALKRQRSMVNQAALTYDASDEFNLTRCSVASWTESLAAELARCEAAPAVPHFSARFSGPHVLGSSGISHDLWSKAGDELDRTVRAMMAKKLTGKEPEETGKLAMEDKSALVITGITHGSFGFELSIAGAQSDDMTISPAFGETADELAAALTAVGQEDDDAFAEAFSKIPKRAAENFRKFLEIAKDFDASVVFDGTEINGEIRVEKIAAAVERVKRSVTTEVRQTISGTLVAIDHKLSRVSIQPDTGELVRIQLSKDTQVNQWESLSVTRRYSCEVVSKTVTIAGRARTPSNVAIGFLSLIGA